MTTDYKWLAILGNNDVHREYNYIHGALISMNTGH